MLSVLKEDTNVYIPKGIKDEISLVQGKDFALVVNNGVLHVIPSIDCSDKRLKEINKDIEEAEIEEKNGEIKAYDSIKEMFTDMGLEVDV